jgi:hypothetical protein
VYVIHTKSDIRKCYPEMLPDVAEMNSCVQLQKGITGKLSCNLQRCSGRF